MRHRYWLLLALTASGCLPERENPLDSSLRPVADLAVVDTGDPAPCGDDLAGDFPEVFIAGRGRCLLLDASASTDPNSDTMKYTYSWSATKTGARTDLATRVLENRFPLDADFLRSRPLNEIPTWFHVLVEDGHGSKSEATTNLILRNAPPSAIVPPPRTVEIGGLPWAPSDSVAVAFFAIADDPDGDQLTEWCWTFPDAGELCRPTATDPDFVRVLSTKYPATYRATLRVSDGDARSVAQSTWMRVEENAWAIDPSGDVYSLSTLPALAPDETNAGTRAVAVHRAVPGSDSRSLIAASTYYDPPSGGLSNVVQEVYLGRWPDASRIGARFPVPPLTFDALAFDPDGTWLWLSTGTEVRTYAVSTSTGLSDTAPGVLGWTPVPSIGTDTFSGDQLEVDDAGNLWIAERAGATVTSVTPAGGQSVYPVALGRGVAAIARRPQAGEIWVLESADDIGATTGASILVFSGPGAAPTTIPIPGSSANGLAWIDGSFFWMSFADKGLLLMDADALVAGVPFFDATALEVPDAPRAYTLRADPGTGDCWAIGGTAFVGSTDTARITLAGEVTRSEMFGFAAAAVDPAGSYWLDSDSTGIRRVDTLLPSGARREIPLSPTDELEIDLASGNLWTSGSPGAGILEMAPDGTILRSFQTVLLDGSEVPVPIHLSFRLQPGSDLAWVVHGGYSNFYQIDQQHGLYRYDFSTAPPVATLVLSSSELAYYSTGSNFIESAAGFDASLPSILVPTHQGHVWTVKADANDPFTVPNQARFVALAPNGSEQASFAIPATEGPASNGFFDFRGFEFRAAASQRDGRLCAATLDQATNPATLRLRWISPIDGTSQQLTAFQVPAATASQLETTVAAVAVSRWSATEDICWVALQAPENTVDDFRDNSGTVYGLTSNFGFVRALSVPAAGEILSMVASSTNHLWIGTDQDRVPNVTRLIEATYNEAGFFWQVENHASTLHTVFPVSAESSRPFDTLDGEF